MKCPHCGEDPKHARTGCVFVQRETYAAERCPTERVSCHACGRSFEYGRCLLCNGYGVADGDTDAARKLLGMIRAASEKEEALVGIPNSGNTGMMRDTLIRAALVAGLRPEDVSEAVGYDVSEWERLTRLCDYSAPAAT